MCGCSSLGCRVRVDLIGRDCELEIFEILLMVDPGGKKGGGGGGGGGWIASSRVWVHGMVIHHSCECGLSFSLGTMSNEDS